MPRFKAVIFDLDDTLYAERDYVLSGFRAVARWAEDELGVRADEAFGYLSNAFETGCRGDTFDRWLDSIGRSRTLVPDLVRVYRGHGPSLTPWPGARELLAALRGNVRIGLISDGYLDVQRTKLAALALGDYFDAVVFSDQWGRSAWKPSTRPFEEALSRLGVAAADAVYVADNALKDFRGARTVGMATVRSRHCNGDYACREASSRDGAADVTFDSFDEVSRYLLRACGVGTLMGRGAPESPLSKKE